MTRGYPALPRSCPVMPSGAIFIERYGPTGETAEGGEMSTKNPIISLGELSKPATVLIEKISEAVGGLFKPYQVIRVAKAEAEAERIRAEGQIQISDLHRRAFYRWLDEEAKKQRNIEDITRQALPELKEESQPDKIENDWIANFFDKCRLISDSEMQQLWSRVLAGEANAPGTYSKRTVNFLSSLDKSDAALFTELCSFGWSIGGLVPLVFDARHEVYMGHGINFDSLSHLESIGLIQFGSYGGFMKLEIPKRIRTMYYGQHVDLEFPSEHGNPVEIGKVMLTKVGHELAPICGSKPDQGFFNYVVNYWKQRGYIKVEGQQPTSGGPA